LTGLWNHLILYLQFQSCFFSISCVIVCKIKVLIYKRVCDHVTYTIIYSTSIGNLFQPLAHMYTITCGQPESFCLSEKYLRSLDAPLVQNSTWRDKSNASLYLSTLNSSCIFNMFWEKRLLKQLIWAIYELIMFGMTVLDALIFLL